MIWYFHTNTYSLARRKPGINGNWTLRQECPPGMSFSPVARGSFENTNCSTRKTGVVTEMLTKRIFAPKN